MDKFTLAQAIIDGNPTDEQILRMAAVIGLTDKDTAGSGKSDIRRFTELVDGLGEEQQEEFRRLLSTFVK